jgi:hypothetical protein
MVLISPLVRTFQAANQLAGMVVLPIVMLLGAPIMAVMSLSAWPRALWFRGPEGESLLTGPVIEQMALHGIPNRIRDLNQLSGGLFVAMTEIVGVAVIVGLGLGRLDRASGPVLWRDSGKDRQPGGTGDCPWLARCSRGTAADDVL